MSERVKMSEQHQQYRNATEEEGREIFREATKWFENAPAASMFGSCTGITKSSVAEYIANQQGLTLYKFAGNK